MTFRTDRNNNPTAFTTGIARLAGLIEGTDFKTGDSFVSNGTTYYTAHLLDDPLQITVKVIDKLTFYTRSGRQRWAYIGIPTFIWNNLNIEDKIRVIKFMYHHEGGSELEKLF